MRQPSVKNRIKSFLREYPVGKVFTGKHIKSVVGDSTEWARRLRELRADEEWPILSHHDDHSLKPGEYRLSENPPAPDQAYSFSTTISTRIRAQVLERNGYTCQMCGAGAGDPDALNPSRKVRLHVGHIRDKSHGGSDTLGNLRALCSTCNQGAKNLTQEPPSWTHVLAEIRRASVDNQKKALEWLQRKFENTP